MQYNIEYWYAVYLGISLEKTSVEYKIEINTINSKRNKIIFNCLTKNMHVNPNFTLCYLDAEGLTHFLKK